MDVRDERGGESKERKSNGSRGLRLYSSAPHVTRVMARQGQKINRKHLRQKKHHSTSLLFVYRDKDFRSTTVHHYKHSLVTVPVFHSLPNLPALARPTPARTYGQVGRRNYNLEHPLRMLRCPAV